MATQDHPTPPQLVDWRKCFSLQHIAFIDSVASLNYRKRCAILRRESLPHFLYKFRSCASPDGSDIWIDRLRDVLVRSRLWLSSRESFNDPYDTSSKAVFGGDARDVRRTFDKIAKERGANWRDRQKEVGRIMSSGIEKISSRAQRVFDRIASAAGIYSFGGNPLNILMWSHYGDNHGGLCFQFDVAQDIAIFTAALPVCYSADYPILDWVGINKNESESVEKMLLRKFEGWAYEEERRIIIQEGAGKYLAFRPAALTRIIIGCRAAEETVERLSELLAEWATAGLPPLKIYRAFKHESKYRLILKRLILKRV